MHQIGAGGGADDQRPAGEHPDQLVAVGQQVGQVLVGVPGSAQGAQGQPAQVDLVAVAQPAVAVGALPGRRGKQLRAVGGQVDGAGDEVGVQVGVGGVGDGEPTLLHSGVDRAQV